MIITIDGPAGAGKSTVTRLLAQRLGYRFLDTGAMYRAVTLTAMDREVDLNDPQALGELARNLEIEFKGDQIWVDGINVSHRIRTPEVARNIKFVADAIEVREHLVKLQRAIASTGNFVCEGRDQGTVAFPDAQCKVFLTASVDQRAKRRAQQLKASGIEFDWAQLLVDQAARDLQDTSRPVGRLQRAEDAIELNTDNKTLEKVVSELLTIVAPHLPTSNVTSTVNSNQNESLS